MSLLTVKKHYAVVLFICVLASCGGGGGGSGQSEVAAPPQQVQVTPLPKLSISSSEIGFSKSGSDQPLPVDGE